MAALLVFLPEPRLALLLQVALVAVVYKVTHAEEMENWQLVALCALTWLSQRIALFGIYAILSDYFGV
jgi:hypothetical protein